MLMFKCGITGSKGNLGKTFIKNYKKIKYIKFKGNITNKKDVTDWIKKSKVDYIIHFAALVPVSKVDKNYKKAREINFIGTKNLVDATIKYNQNIKWFFFSSTSHVYPYKNIPIKEDHLLKPISKYGKTKLLAENYIIKKFKKTKINFCIGRIFSIFDNHGKDFFLKSLIKKINIKEKKIVLNNMNHYRDFLSTKKISYIIKQLLIKNYKGIINIGSGKKTHLKKVARIVGKKFKKKIIFRNNKITCSVSNNLKLTKLDIKLTKLNVSKELNLIDLN